MGVLPDDRRQSLAEATSHHLADAMPRDQYHAWLVEDQSGPVAGGGIHLRSTIPSPQLAPGDVEAVVMGVWTDHDHRRRGLARQIMGAILEWCGERKIGFVTLHATAAGRPLYEQLGFKATNQMRFER